jgi:hypothetical protein
MFVAGMFARDDQHIDAAGGRRRQANHWWRAHDLAFVILSAAKNPRTRTSRVIARVDSSLRSE